jgi:hypothetical protein
LIDRAGPFSFPKSSGHGSRRQKQPAFKQHFLKRLPDPHGQRSFLPSFSASSLLPWTILTPRFTFFSDGNPRRRLLIGLKKCFVFEVLLVYDAPPFLKDAMATTHPWTRIGPRGSEEFICSRPAGRNYCLGVRILQA